MPNVQSVESYQRMYERKSSLLNPPGRHERPRSSSCLSLEDARNEIASNDVNEHGEPIGKLMRLKKLRREKQAEFKRTKHEMYLEDANRISGMLLVLEKECRLLNVMIAENNKRNKKYSSNERAVQKNVKRLLKGGN